MSQKQKAINKMWEIIIRNGGFISSGGVRKFIEKGAFDLCIRGDIWIRTSKEGEDGVGGREEGNGKGREAIEAGEVSRRLARRESQRLRQRMEKLGVHLEKSSDRIRLALR